MIFKVLMFHIIIIKNYCCMIYNRNKFAYLNINIQTNEFINFLLFITEIKKYIYFLIYILSWNIFYKHRINLKSNYTYGIINIL